MQISVIGVDAPEGKVKYEDAILAALAEKFEPKKVTPYYFEFISDVSETADAFVTHSDSILDLLIIDIEKLENRLERAEEENERKLLKKCLEQLENELPVCDLEFDETEQLLINGLAPLSLKPVLIIDNMEPDINTLCEQVMNKAGVMFFYTAGKQEAHAWFVDKGSDAVTCAGKIHSDFARGFIKAEIISFDDLMTAHNFSDAGKKGLTKLVDREYIIPEKTVLEIRFNV